MTSDDNGGAVQGLRESAIRHEEMIGTLGDELGSLARTVQTLVDSQTKLYESTQSAISGAVTDMRKLVDGRTGADKSRMVSTVAIIVPVIITIFGVLLSFSYSNSVRIEKLMEVRVDQAYKDGVTVGTQQAINDRLGRLEGRLGEMHSKMRYESNGN